LHYYFHQVASVEYWFFSPKTIILSVGYLPKYHYHPSLDYSLNMNYTPNGYCLAKGWQVHCSEQCGQLSRSTQELFVNIFS